MEIICAGYPKTGSKSCTAALEELGVKVCDAMDTMEHLAKTWIEYMDGKIPIGNVLAKYHEHGFQANQDLPGNILWEDLYNASPHAKVLLEISITVNKFNYKVILTVRDTTEAWENSYFNFLKQEAKRRGDLAFYFFMKFSQLRMMSPEMNAWMTIAMRLMNTHLSPGIDTPRVEFFNTIEKRMKYLESFRDVARAGYEAHIEHVKKTVPKERLLVWNVKEGWEPLCKFLHVPVPEKPFPHANRTGDLEWGKKYYVESDFLKYNTKCLRWNVTKAVLKLCLISGVIIYELKNEFRLTKAIKNVIGRKIKNSKVYFSA